MHCGNKDHPGENRQRQCSQSSLQWGVRRHTPRGSHLRATSPRQSPAGGGFRAPKGRRSCVFTQGAVGCGAKLGKLAVLDQSPPSGLSFGFLDWRPQRGSVLFLYMVWLLVCLCIQSLGVNSHDPHELLRSWCDYDVASEERKPSHKTVKGQCARSRSHSL